MRAQAFLAGAPAALAAIFAAKDYIWLALLLGAFGTSIVDAFMTYNHGNIIVGIIFSSLATIFTMWIPLEYLSQVHLFNMPVTMMMYGVLSPIPLIGTWLIYMIDFMRFIGFVYLVGYPFVRFVIDA
jgi:hypothetical protein